MAKDKDVQWLFYHIVGIEMENDPDQLHDLMFRHATLFSRDDARTFINSMPFSSSKAKDADHTRIMLGINSSPGPDDLPQSILAVRANGPTPEMIDESGNDRALEVAAALSMLLLVRLDFWATCCLEEHIIEGGNIQQIRIGSQSGIRRITDKRAQRGQPLWIPDPPIRLSRMNFLKILTDEPTGDLTSILLCGNRKVHGTFREILSSATIFLYETAHSTSPETQLFGAITVIDTLLSGGKSQFDIIKRRIRHLFGEVRYKQFFVDEVFHTRNLVVHSGKLCDWLDARKGLVLALTCLLIASKAAIEFPTLGAFHSYLDFQEETVRFSQAYKHARVSWEGPKLTDHFPDYLPFDLVRFAYEGKRAAHMNVAQQQQKFAEIVHTFATLRSTPLRKAYIVMNNAVVNSPQPFKSFSAFSSYYYRHKITINAEGAELVDMLQQRQMWYTGIVS